MSSLTQLVQLIAKSVSTLEKVCADNSLNLPQIEDDFRPESEAFRANACAAEAATVIGAAAFQLAALVLPPFLTVYHVASGSYKAAALRVALESNVVEILREAGPDGLHIDQIAAESKVEGMKLGRFLRFLATQHIFREVKPDVFANNRISGTLDTGKPLCEIQARPTEKHDGTRGFAAFMEHIMGDSHKASAYVLETIREPSTRCLGELSHSPFQKAFGTNMPFFSWYDLPEQAYQRHRFGIAMQGLASMQPTDAILDAFDWKSLPDSACVVDVAGGLGTSALSIAKAHPRLRIIVQDKPSVVEEGKKLWKREMPLALWSCRVKFQKHDFFTSQPIKSASVFLLKQILHDWPDIYCVHLLTHLREAATQETKLLIVDNILAYACHQPANEFDIPGAIPHEAPAPLLPNYGPANDMRYAMDFAMFMLFNGQERTIGHLSKLLESAGWRIVKVNRLPNYYEPIIAIPI